MRNPPDYPGSNLRVGRSWRCRKIKSGLPVLVLSFFAAVSSFSLAAADISSRYAKNLLLTFGDLVKCPLIPLAGEDRSVFDKQLTEPIRAAEGKRIEVTGYMLPVKLEGGRAQQFLLMRTQMACCFGQTPGANEFVVVNAASPGVPVSMDIPVVIEGVFHVAPVMIADSFVQYYSLENAVIFHR